MKPRAILIASGWTVMLATVLGMMLALSGCASREITHFPAQIKPGLWLHKPIVTMRRRYDCDGWFYPPISQRRMDRRSDQVEGAQR